MQRIAVAPYGAGGLGMVGEQPVDFVADGLRLHGLLAIPPSAVSAVVVCHPHPSYGGTMDNSVVRAVTQALGAAGVATLRFNFRGVPPSEGQYGNLVGECDDARAAVALLRERTSLAKVTLAGYSFGASVALRVGHELDAVDRLVAIAPPIALLGLDFLADCRKSKLFLLGDRDEYCPRVAFDGVAKTLADPLRVEVLAGADHFLFGFEDAIGNAAARFVTEPVAMSDDAEAR